MDITGHTYIQHQIINRPWGPECQFTVAVDGVGHVDDVIRIPSADIGDEALAALIKPICDQRASRAAFIASLRTEFSGLGEEIKEAIFWIIRNVRKYPNVTLAQAEAAWDAEWSDSLFTWDKLVAYVTRAVGGVTWDGFKTFVINHNFKGLDD